MYSLADYGSMVADRVRMGAYAEALKRSVQPGSVVVDLGAGAGIMSLIAVQSGAVKVYAIEPSEALEVGRSMARANGMEDRIEFINACSEAVTLPERADVVVSDIRGVLPLLGENFRALADARERFLKPGGIFIPQCDTLWAALVEDPAAYGELTGGWDSDGLDLSAGRRMVLNSWKKLRATPQQLVSEPVQWAQVDYRNLTSPSVAGHGQAPILRPGTAHGLCLWFDTVLLDGVGFSNAPSRPKAIYGQGFFPLLEPIAVEPGDSVRIAIRADLAGGDYTWTWNTCIRSSGGSIKTDQKQSSFFAMPFSAANLRMGADTFVPPSTKDATVDLAILDRFGSGQSLRQISVEVALRFPDRFRDWKAALDRVAALSVRYPG
ncbi:MAG TPA: 50S ribosomal protein L11 methyltransferase [Candidatus Acidoferrales bacterium]|jgi:protein arginine N-methyltransferase 1|nr:50S ribosomal protein L11 methyltransferase [Candidatus Acidoferrales bacterium]